MTPVGGGGLLSGCATIAKSLRPGIRIFGVEPELANDTALSIAARRADRHSAARDHRRRPAFTDPRHADVSHHAAARQEILLVSEEQIREAMRFLMERMKIVVEPSGAVGGGGGNEWHASRGIRSAGVVISGGNVDLDFLKTL